MHVSNENYFLTKSKHLSRWHLTVIFCKTEAVFTASYLKPGGLQITFWEMVQGGMPKPSS